MKMGSLFSGIGGLDLGLERAIPGLQTVWQVEKNSFCRSVLERHWPDATRYNNVRTVGAHNLEPIDILCGGFPCQDISIAGKGEGLDGERSGLWWEFHRLINELRPRVAVMENVSAIYVRGLSAVVGSLSQIGYDCQWTIISAAQCGAPHLRRRWFGVAYTNSQRIQEQPIWSKSVGTARQSQCGGSQTSWTKQDYWKGFPTQSPVCRRDDGVPNRVDRLRALGNAVVPQCAQWVGQQIVNSGLLEVACSQHN
jgi:DNA (cytosine-5)-methyltransferase 1